MSPSSFLWRWTFCPVRLSCCQTDWQTEGRTGQNSSPVFPSHWKSVFLKAFSYADSLLYRYMVVIFQIVLAIHINDFTFQGARVAQWVRSLDLTTQTSLSPIRRGFAPGFVNYKKGAFDSQPQVIKFTSCLPMVGGFLRVLRLPPPLKLVAMI